MLASPRGGGTLPHVNADESESPLLKISPGARAGLILVGLMLAALGLFGWWLLPEARRIQNQKRVTQMANAEYEARGEGDMVWVPAGKFTMGGIGADIPEDETPLHDVKIDSFWMDRTEVTNEQFARFVEATQYVTLAEREKGSALCFRPRGDSGKLKPPQEWWTPVAGADWRHPEGPASDITARMKHPVVQVCHADALAYCHWAGKRLPTEAEWEYAARGGMNAQPFVWGRQKAPVGRAMANVWQGEFPLKDEALDGFAGTAPVESFQANGYGLFDLAGNVWELTEDWYRADTYSRVAKNADKSARRNPAGPQASSDPSAPAMPKVARGGSFLSGEHDRLSYRPSARLPVGAEVASQHTGFRCAKDGTPR